MPQATEPACYSIWNIAIDLKIAESGKKRQNLPHKYNDYGQRDAWLNGSWGHQWGAGPWLLVETLEHSCQRLPIPKAMSLAGYSIWKLAIDLKLAESGKLRQNPPHKYNDYGQRDAWLNGSWGHQWGAGPWLPVETLENSCQRLPTPKAMSLVSYNIWKLSGGFKLAESGKLRQNPPHKYHDYGQRAAWLNGSWGHQWGAGPCLPVETPENSCQQLPIPKAMSLVCYNICNLSVDLKLAESRK